MDRVRFIFCQNENPQTACMQAVAAADLLFDLYQSRSELWMVPDFHLDLDSDGNEGVEIITTMYLSYFG